MKYSIIAAIADNLAIGKNNRIPWHISGDLKLFKKLTTGNIVIMGRKTFDSIGKPLPGRTTIVISRSPDEFIQSRGTDDSPENLIACSSLNEALDTAEKLKEDRAADPAAEIFVAGGASIYQKAIGKASKLYLSRVPGAFDADTFFPDFSRSVWEIETVENFNEFRLEIYTRS